MSDSKLHASCDPDSDVCGIDDHNPGASAKPTPSPAPEGPEPVIAGSNPSTMGSLAEGPPIFNKVKPNFIKLQLYIQKPDGEKFLVEKKDLLENEFMRYMKQFIRNNDLNGGKVLLEAEWCKYIPRDTGMESGVLELDSSDEDSDEEGNVDKKGNEV